MGGQTARFDMSGFKELKASVCTTSDICKSSSETKGAQAPAQTKRRIIYIRVSSTQQRQDLGRQQKDLKKACPNHEVIADIGSDINFKRKGFVALLVQCRWIRA